VKEVVEKNSPRKKCGYFNEAEGINHCKMGYPQVVEKNCPRNGWTNHIVGYCASVAEAANQWLEEIKVSERKWFSFIFFYNKSYRYSKVSSILLF